MINCDGSFVSETGRGGWGCLARNSDGELLFAAAGSFEHLADAMHAETASLMKAIQLAEQFCMGRIILSTDCLALQRCHLQIP